MLSQNYKSCSTVRVGADVVSVVAVYCDLVCVCMVHCACRYCGMGYPIDHMVIYRVSLRSEPYTRTPGQNIPP